jgi:hypothetical protein
MGHDDAEEPERIVVDGWTTVYNEEYIRFYLQPPPRRLGSVIFAQLWVDAKSFRPQVLCALGSGLIVLGFTLLHWVTAVVGALMLLFYLLCFLFMMRNLKFAPLATAVIRSLTPNPLISEMSFAAAVEPDGKVVKVVFHTRMVADMLERDGQCEVLFYRSDPDLKGGGRVIAARECGVGAGKGDSVESVLP